MEGWVPEPRHCRAGLGLNIRGRAPGRLGVRSHRRASRHVAFREQELSMHAAKARVVSDLSFTNTSPLSQSPACSGSRWSELELLILLGTVGHVVSLGASSFIEEEHQTWYFLVNTLCLALCHQVYNNYFPGPDEEPQCCPHVADGCDCAAAALQGGRPGRDGAALGGVHESPASPATHPGHEKWVVLASPWLILACCRLLRSLNQTGVQWAHRPDLGHWLTR